MVCGLRVVRRRRYPAAAAAAVICSTQGSSFVLQVIQVPPCARFLAVLKEACTAAIELACRREHLISCLFTTSSLPSAVH